MWSHRPQCYSANQILLTQQNKHINTCQNTCNHLYGSPHLNMSPEQLFGFTFATAAGLEKTTRSSLHHVAQHRPTGSRNNTTLRSPKQQVWLRIALCGGWCRRMALRYRKSCMPETTTTTRCIQERWTAVQVVSCMHCLWEEAPQLLSAGWSDCSTDACHQHSNWVWLTDLCAVG